MEKQPTPSSKIYDDGGSLISWLAEEFSPEDICDEDGEDGWMELIPDRLREIWLTARWTTPEELADEDMLFDIFGDWEMSGVATDIVYDFATVETPGAHRYWTTEY